MAISQEFLKLATNECLQSVRELRITGHSKRIRGRFTSYNEGETTLDVVLIDEELNERREAAEAVRLAEKRLRDGDHSAGFAAF